MTTLDLTVITCTSDRPEAFRLCAIWMLRQDFPGTIQWVVVEDSREKYAEPLLSSELAHETGGAFFDLAILGRKPQPNGVASFRGNLIAGIERAESERICFVEDDDHYKPQWLSLCFNELHDVDAFGETAARYYHVRSRHYQRFLASGHASLGQTAVRRHLALWLRKWVSKNGDSFHGDFAMWRQAARHHKAKLLPKSGHVTSMKGLPGKPNLGVGARLSRNGKLDAGGGVLRKWVGEADAKLYGQFHERPAVPD